jgi:hypothetical protein
MQALRLNSSSTIETGIVHKGRAARRRPRTRWNYHFDGPADATTVGDVTQDEE